MVRDKLGSGMYLQSGRLSLGVSRAELQFGHQHRVAQLKLGPTYVCSLEPESVLHLRDAMSRAETLTEGRTAYVRRAWNTAYAQLAAADAEAALDGDDLEHLGMAAHLSGRDEASEDALARAHQAFLAQGDTPRAARCAIWLIFELHGRGEVARSSGWSARAERLLAARPDCVERGYLLVPPRSRRSCRETSGRAATSSRRLSRSASVSVTGTWSTWPSRVVPARWCGSARSTTMVLRTTAGRTIVLSQNGFDGHDPLALDNPFCAAAR